MKTPETPSSTKHPGPNARPDTSPRLRALAINTIRTLSVDAVQRANSGHPGAPMALAPVAYLLWQEFLNFDPDDPQWPGRDRFILSNGHASMLLYSLLHLCQVRRSDPNPGADAARLAITLDDIRRFRQLGSPCAGHPEYGLAAGIETTTGPLGQGVATSVGMAIAQKWLESQFGELFNYRVHVICGDGDLMEGLSSEAASLAGHLKLDSLTWIYDSNRITIEGGTELAFSEDVATRFVGMGWNVTRVGDANDLPSLRRAMETARDTRGRPTLIIVNSEIGYGAPHKQGKSSAHGEALGEEEVRLAKRSYGWPEDGHFRVPTEVVEHFEQGFGARGKARHAEWNAKREAFERANPEKAEWLALMVARGLPASVRQVKLPDFPASAKGLSTREASFQVLNAIAPHLPWLLGGAADLAPSTRTVMTGVGEFSAENRSGRNLHFGVREHAMGAIVNGLALSGLRSYGATFLIFSDYEKPAIRLSALMELPVLHIFTHDSIGVGEDGPTHQPIEQLAALRATPGLHVFRPADGNEVSECWKAILGLGNVPSALALTRQAVPTIDRTRYAPASGAARGAYVLAESSGTPEVIYISTGSEVVLCLEACERLKADGVRVRVVSMPCWELFELQDRVYRDQVLPPQVTARVAVEQASTFGWDRYVGSQGICIGMRTFGASAPIKELLTHFGFTVEHLVLAARHLLGHEKGPLSEPEQRGRKLEEIELRSITRSDEGKHR